MRVMAKRRDDTMDSLPEPRRVRVSRPARPESAEAFAARVAGYAADALGVPVSAAQRARARAERRKAIDAGEAEATGRVRAPGRKALKSLRAYDRSKPTPEQAGRGVYEVEKAERFDTSRKGEKVLVNLAGRAGGAATMFKRGQIQLRELRAAEKLCELHARSQTSQLSGGGMNERVDGGMVDLTGNRLQAASAAFGEYREALETLTRAGRILVENVIVGGMPMEDAVRLRTVAHRLGAGNMSANVRWRTTKAMIVVGEALESLADHFNIAKA